MLAFSKLLHPYLCQPIRPLTSSSFVGSSTRGIHHNLKFQFHSRRQFSSHHSHSHHQSNGHNNYHYEGAHSSSSSSSAHNILNISPETLNATYVGMVNYNLGEIDAENKERIVLEQGQLPKTVLRLELNGCIIYLIGSNHVQRELSQDVARVIDITQPDVVFLELCAQRTSLLSARTERMVDETPDSNPPRQPLKFSQLMRIVLQNSPQHLQKIFFFRIAERQSGAMTGIDMLTAARAGKKCGALIVIGDRPYKISDRRYQAARKNTPEHVLAMDERRWDSARAGLHSYEQIPSIQQYIENTRRLQPLNASEPQQQQLQAANNIQLPPASVYAKVFIDERDTVMAAALQRVTKMLSRLPSPHFNVFGRRRFSCPTSPSSTSSFVDHELEMMLPSTDLCAAKPDTRPVIVAVVGLAHTPGIVSKLQRPISNREVIDLFRH